MTKPIPTRLLALALAILSLIGIPTALAQDAIEPPAMPPPLIMVGLMRAKSVTLTCQGPFRLTGSGESRLLPANAAVTLCGSGGQVTWDVSGGGASQPAVTEPNPVQITVDDPQSGPLILITKHENASTCLEGTGYAGRLVIMPGGVDLVVANVTDIETYVKSVVSCEMSDGWPLESLKAQAVAARSYAAYRVCMQKTPGFGLPDYRDFLSETPDSVKLWATDQVYKGVLAQKPNAVTATDLTRGEILTYGGSPIAAYFHSSAEGMTEDARYVWGGNIPYLRPVKEIAYQSPYWEWTAEFDPETLLARLGGLGVTGPIDSICGTEPGLSGRWYGVSIKTPQGVTWLKGTSVRGALGTPLRSLLFSSYKVGAGQMTTACLNPALSAFALTGGDGVTLNPGASAIVGATGTVSASGGNRGLYVLSGLADLGPSRVVLRGKGWGHGVGLSQWGARAMALAGCASRDILATYYPGTALDPWW